MNPNFQSRYPGVYKKQSFKPIFICELWLRFYFEIEEKDNNCLNGNIHVGLYKCESLNSKFKRGCIYFFIYVRKVKIVKIFI